MIFYINNKNYELDPTCLDKYCVFAPFTWCFFLKAYEVPYSGQLEDDYKFNAKPNFIIYGLIFAIIPVLKSLDFPILSGHVKNPILIMIIMYCAMFSILRIKRKMFNGKSKLATQNKYVKLRIIPNNKYYKYVCLYLTVQCFLIVGMYVLITHITFLYLITAIGLCFIICAIQHNHWYHYIRCNCEIIIKEDIK